jgi:hypothetical protein
VNYSQIKIFLKFKGILTILFLLSVLTYLPLEAQRTLHRADYLIVENVDQLLIYNKYQQRISKQEKEQFVPFVPMRILESQLLLNDNYTPCIKIEISGNTFYLIKNDKTTLIGEGKLGFNRFYRNVIVLKDTIKLSTNNDVELTSPDNKNKIILSKGEDIIRFFQNDKQIYVNSLHYPIKYGWIGIANNYMQVAEQENKPGINSQYGPPEVILRQIEMKITEVNSLLVNLVKYFNKQTNKKNAIPQWRLISSKNNLTYVLEPFNCIRYYKESSQYLKRDFDNILLGTNYMTSYTPGRIEIYRK